MSVRIMEQFVDNILVDFASENLSDDDDTDDELVCNVTLGIGAVLGEARRAQGTTTNQRTLNLNFASEILRVKGPAFYDAFRIWYSQYTILEAAYLRYVQKVMFWC